MPDKSKTPSRLSLFFLVVGILLIRLNDTNFHLETFVGIFIFAAGWFCGGLMLSAQHEQRNELKNK